MSIEVRIPLLIMVGLALAALAFGETAGDRAVSGQVVGRGRIGCRGESYVSSFTHKNHAEPKVARPPERTGGSDSRRRQRKSAWRDGGDSSPRVWSGLG